MRSGPCKRRLSHDLSLVFERRSLYALDQLLPAKERWCRGSVADVLNGGNEIDVLLMIVVWGDDHLKSSTDFGTEGENRDVEILKFNDDNANKLKDRSRKSECDGQAHWAMD